MEDLDPIKSENKEKDNSIYDYGNVKFIAFLTIIYSALAYRTTRDFLFLYNEIIGNENIITEDLMTDMNSAVKNNGIAILMDDKRMFDLNEENEEKYGMKLLLPNEKNENTTSLQFLPFSKKINILFEKQRLAGEYDPNCEIDTNLDSRVNDNLVFVNITTQFYGDIYIVGDTRMPNIVYVVFRGTTDFESMKSYLNPSTVTPTLIATWRDKNGKSVKIKVLYGIYKV